MWQKLGDKLGYLWEDYGVFIFPLILLLFVIFIGFARGYQQSHSRIPVDAYLEINQILDNEPELKIYVAKYLEDGIISRSEMDDLRTLYSNKLFSNLKERVN